MTESPAIDTAAAQYGPISFVVALLHILVVDLATWLCVLPLPPLAVLALPITLAYLAIAAAVAKGPGRVGQVGRGMLLGSLSAPLSLLIFIPGFIIAQAIGPI